MGWGRWAVAVLLGCAAAERRLGGAGAGGVVVLMVMNANVEIDIKIVVIVVVEFGISIFPPELGARDHDAAAIMRLHLRQLGVVILQGGVAFQRGVGVVVER